MHHQELPCRTVSFSFSSSFSSLKSHLDPVCLQNRMCVSSSIAHLVGQVLHEFKSSESKTTRLRRADEGQFLILIHSFHFKRMDQKVILLLHNIS